ncbi:unnamed protein product [Symbiodinium sp. CCMP2592]|nr:unnamed protein product [Symbiodinium sp. CCMP2592]
MDSLSSRSTVQQLATALQLSIPASAASLGDLTLLSFGLGTVNLEGLDAFLASKGWSPDADELPVLRILWVQAQKICTLPSVASDSSASTLHTSWAETFPPKLSSETTLQLKRDFEKSYPSEILDDTNFPSARLLSLAYRLKGTSDWKFISWKHRLSKQQEEDYNSSRPRKLARFENFTDVLYDDVPSRNVAENMGLYGISNLLSIHSNALALADIAHLATLRSYERKFLKHVQARPDPTLRPPNAQECEAADRRCWEVVGQLRQEGWSVDDALHEFTDVRAELVALLAPRLAPFKGKKGDGKGGKEPWKGLTPKGGKSTGGKGGTTPGKGKSTFTKGTHAFEWANKAKINGETKVLCMAYSTHKGCTSNNCKFEHLCPVILENGKICLQKHPAFQHAQKAGEEGLVPVALPADATGDAPFSPPGTTFPEPVVQSAPQNFACSVSELDSGFFLDINGGARRPLSAAFLGAGCDTFSVAPEIFPERDLLQDAFFFSLLRVCHSGQVALLHILLCAGDFPSNLFDRMIQIAHACFAAGSHVLLSQHSGSSVWSHASVIFLLQQMGADAIFWDPQRFGCNFDGFGHVKARFDPPFANQDGAGIYSVEAFADARADGELIGIGGFIAFPSGAYIWFSQAWQLSDLSVLSLELRRPAHKDIACYETLAQIALVHAYRSVFPSGRVAVRLPSFSDNASTEALGAKLYTAKWPLGAFAQKLSLISAASGIELDISHIAGEKNDDADLLSRWNQTDSLPDKWRKEDRVDCSLKFIWFFRKEVLVWPSHFSLPAETPERHVSDDDI